MNAVRLFGGWFVSTDAQWEYAILHRRLLIPNGVRRHLFTFTNIGNGNSEMRGYSIMPIHNSEGNQFVA